MSMSPLSPPPPTAPFRNRSSLRVSSAKPLLQLASAGGGNGSRGSGGGSGHRGSGRAPKLYLGVVTPGSSGGLGLGGAEDRSRGSRKGGTGRSTRGTGRRSSKSRGSSRGLMGHSQSMPNFMKPLTRTGGGSSGGGIGGSGGGANGTQLTDGVRSSRNRVSEGITHRTKHAGLSFYEGPGARKSGGSGGGGKRWRGGGEGGVAGGEGEFTYRDMRFDRFDDKAAGAGAGALVKSGRKVGKTGEGAGGGSAFSRFKAIDRGGGAAFESVLQASLLEHDPEGTGAQLLLKDWLKQYIIDSSQFQSPLVFCEVKTKELFRLTAGLPKPNAFRTWVAQDLLVKVIENTRDAGAKALLTRVLDILLNAVCSSAETEMGLEPYALRARRLEERLGQAQHKHSRLNQKLLDVQGEWVDTMERWQPWIDKAASNWNIPFMAVVFQAWRQYARFRVKRFKDTHNKLLQPVQSFSNRIAQLRHRHDTRSLCGSVFHKWRQLTIRSSLGKMVHEQEALEAHNKACVDRAKTRRRAKYGLRDQIEVMEKKLVATYKNEKELRLQVEEAELRLTEMAHQSGESEALIRQYSQLMSSLVVSLDESVSHLHSAQLQDATEVIGHLKKHSILRALKVGEARDAEAKDKGDRRQRREARRRGKGKQSEKGNEVMDKEKGAAEGEAGGPGATAGGGDGAGGEEGALGASGPLDKTSRATRAEAYMDTADPAVLQSWLAIQFEHSRALARLAKLFDRQAQQQRQVAQGEADTAKEPSSSSSSPPSSAPSTQLTIVTNASNEETIATSTAPPAAAAAAPAWVTADWHVTRQHALLRSIFARSLPQQPLPFPTPVPLAPLHPHPPRSPRATPTAQPQGQDADAVAIVDATADADPAADAATGVMEEASTEPLSEVLAEAGAGSTALIGEVANAAAETAVAGAATGAGSKESARAAAARRRKRKPPLELAVAERPYGGDILPMADLRLLTDRRMELRVEPFVRRSLEVAEKRLLFNTLAESRLNKAQAARRRTQYLLATEQRKASGLREVTQEEWEALNPIEPDPEVNAGRKEPDLDPDLQDASSLWMALAHPALPHNYDELLCHMAELKEVSNQLLKPEQVTHHEQLSAMTSKVADAKQALDRERTHSVANHAAWEMQLRAAEDSVCSRLMERIRQQQPGKAAAVSLPLGGVSRGLDRPKKILDWCIRNPLPADTFGSEEALAAQRQGMAEAGETVQAAEGGPVSQLAACEQVLGHYWHELARAFAEARDERAVMGVGSSKRVPEDYMLSLEQLMRLVLKANMTSSLCPAELVEEYFAKEVRDKQAKQAKLEGRRSSALNAAQANNPLSPKPSSPSHAHAAPLSRQHTATLGLVPPSTPKSASQALAALGASNGSGHGSNPANKPKQFAAALQVNPVYRVFNPGTKRVRDAYAGDRFAPLLDFASFVTVICRIAHACHRALPSIPQRLTKTLKLLADYRVTANSKDKHSFVNVIIQSNAHIVFERHHKFLFNLYCAYTYTYGIGKKGGKDGKDGKGKDGKKGDKGNELEQLFTMVFDAWEHFCSETGLLDPPQVLPFKNIKIIFNKAQNRNSTSMEDITGHLNFAHFREAIAALSCFAFKNPYLPLECKLDNFVTNCLMTCAKIDKTRQVYNTFFKTKAKKKKSKK